MKVAFDTSVLVACSMLGHVHEQRAAVWLDAARRGLVEAMASCHALGECWATLTAIPTTPRIAPATAERLVARLSDYLTAEPLSWQDYRVAIQRCGDRGLRSGSIYDALHLAAAERCGADLLITFDTRHFIRLAGATSPRIVAPPDPPGLGPARDP